MNTTAKEYSKVARLCKRVTDKLREHAADFSSPLPSDTDLEIEYKKLEKLIALAGGDRIKKAERDQQAELVFEMLLKELVYVNRIAAGDKVLVIKSGFDVGKEWQRHGIPTTPVITKIKDGPEACSGKITLAKPLIRRGRYSVQVCYLSDNVVGEPDSIHALDPDSLDWVKVLETVSSNELLLTKLPRGKDVLIRVRAHDGSNKSNWSDFHLFSGR